MQNICLLPQLICLDIPIIAYNSYSSTDLLKCNSLYTVCMASFPGFARLNLIDVMLSI